MHKSNDAMKNKKQSPLTMENSPNTIVDSRKELMISSTAPEISFLRTAHFLKPSSCPNSNGISSLSLPSPPPSFDPKNWAFTVNFYGWNNPPNNWKEWVDEMASLHSPIWKKAGIYEAIFNSTYRFYKNDELVIGVTEKWCPETNSFLFPWGEATVTLEDMFIAGYSVSGSPVFEPFETQESKAIEEALISERQKLNKSSAKKPLHSNWLKVFKDCGSEIEHEAFLSMWLSRFVLPTNRDVISTCVFPIAIQLARGTRYALAPAVLANIYRDLSLLKQKIVSLNELDAKNDKRVVVTTWAPFQLVLVWVWERFVKLSPEPKMINNGESRFARWDNLKCNIKDVRRVIDSCEESFCWRPYTRSLENWDVSKFYREKEMWVSYDSDLDGDLLSFIVCLRVSELVGLEPDCIEQYLPHRVARQFGFDQDVPGCVTRTIPNDAWSSYIRPFTDVRCYIPSRLFEGLVTKRYLDWWNNLELVAHKQETSSDIVAKVKKEESGSLNRTKEDDILISMLNKKRNGGETLLDHLDNVKQSRNPASCSRRKKNDSAEPDGLVVPPGFPAKCVGDCTDEDNLTIAEILKQNRQHVSGKVVCSSRIADNIKVNGGTPNPESVPGKSSVAGNGTLENMELKEAILEENATKTGDEKQDISLNDHEIDSANDSSIEAAFLSVKDQIERVEKLFAATKALLEAKMLTR